MAYLQHFLLLRPLAAIAVTAVLLCFIYQPVTAQATYNSNFHNGRVWRPQAAPSLAAFTSYEDMIDYIAKRNLRGLRKIENPNDDSYIHAFNQHNEQPTPLPNNQRQKRANVARKLPNEPKLFKFEISDAVEPSDAVKALIKKHRSRELALTVKTKEPTTTSSTPLFNIHAKTHLEVSKPRARTKRMALQQRHPDNFKVKMIPFEASDAKESGDEHKEIVKRMRALEMQKPTRTKRTTTALPERRPKSTNSPQTRRARGNAHKRTRRSAPQMIKFELEDAKEPDASMKLMMQQTKSGNRESKEMKSVSASKNSTDSMDADNETSDQSSHESKRFFTYKEPPMKVKKSIKSLPYEVQKVVSNLIKDNQGAKAYIKYIPAQKSDYNHFRSYTYPSVKYVQPSFGTKLQPAASYLKYYVPAQQKEQLQVQIHPVPVVEKVRYVYTPVAADDGQTQQAHAQAAYVPQHQNQQDYVTVAHVAQEHHPATITQPIVVQDAGHGAATAADQHQIAEVHHTYAADLSNLHQEEARAHEAATQHEAALTAHVAAAAQHEAASAAHAAAQHEAALTAHVAAAAQHEAALTAHAAAQHEIAQAHVQHVSTQFHASKPDPLLESNKIADAGAEQQHTISQAYSSVSPGHYKYEVYPNVGYDKKAQLHLLGHNQHVAQIGASVAPLIKIEYHAPPDPVKENYKELAEFQQLSKLMGKSPEDQIHGLSYLLAKEMQTKLKRQQKQLEVETASLQQQQRPQDSTSPIVFHPNANVAGAAAKAAETTAVQHQYKLQPGHLIGMGKTKQYIPIIESKGLGTYAAAEEEALAHQGIKHEFKKVLPEKVPAPTSFVTYGLSPNYEKGAKTYHYATPQVYHGALSNHAPSVGGHQGLHAHAVSSDAEHSHAKVAAAGGGVKQEAHSTGGYPLHLGAHLDDGHALQYASKYAFGYRIRDFHTGNDFGHKQNRDLDGVTRGQYHILLPDGRIQNVIYHADDTGFHADVSFETGH